jgi:hypothetical protein
LIFQARDALLDNQGLMTIGITIVIFILINIILAIVMIYKGIKTKYYTMILIAAIFFAGISAWGGVLFNFFYILITDEFPSWIFNAFFSIQGGALFVFHFIWIMGVTRLSSISKKAKMYLLICVGTICALMEVSWWLIVTTDIGIFGDLAGPPGFQGFPFIVEYSWVSYLYLTGSLMFFTVAGGWIAIESLKSDDRRIKLKAKFLMIYVILITVGSLIEIYDPIENILENFYDVEALDAAVIASYTAKIILTIGVISGYIGFVLPKRVERLFLKT